MKLKFFMGGLGIGLVLATLILTIGGSTKEKLSDSEIKVRAAELGMVMEDNKDLELLKENKPTEIAEQNSITPSVVPTIEPTIVPTIEPTMVPTKAPTPKPTTKPTVEPTKKPVPTIVPEKVTQDSNKEINFTIKSGMSSGQVATMLINAGLIDNADDFNKYIVKKGKASVIRVGNYTLPTNATYDDIIAKITTK